MLFYYIGCIRLYVYFYTLLLRSGIKIPNTTVSVQQIIFSWLNPFV